MVNLYIDNIPVKIAKNSTVLQACDSLGIDIPRFCFHERLLIAGNCRMCLVEIEKSPKPVASCALPVSEGMKVFTKTPLVRKAQEGVLEFLLLNHPLDCPICDQGGECDLQDQVMLFGSDSSRFYERKRGVEDKDCGPLIKTVMTRCIHCTRCVRFSTEVAGVPDLGTLGRGTNTQIGTYLTKMLTSELSGNIIDLCPVGALTSKPYAFEGRPWELRSINSIDIMDSCGSNIVVSVKGSKVFRILPRLNEDINEEWISDKTRFSYDGIRLQRLEAPLFLERSLDNKYEVLKWEEAFNIFFINLYKYIYNLDKKLNIFFGEDVDFELVLVLKYFFNKLNCFSLYSTTNFCSNSSDFFYKFNIKMKDIQKFDCCILVNCNTRFETSMLNLHLRKRVINGDLKVGFFGPFIDYTFEASHLGLDNKSFIDFIKGKHLFSKNLKKFENTLFIINSNSFSNFDLLAINDILKKNVKTFNSLNILNIDANSTGLRDLGIKSFNDYLKLNNCFNKHISLYVGTDLNNSLLNLLNKRNLFSIYCGSHGNENLNYNDLILPGRSFVEKKAGFLNLEGLFQNTNKCFNLVGDSREDWVIFNAFFKFIDKQPGGYLGFFQQNFVDYYSLNSFFNKEFPIIQKFNLYQQSFNSSFKLNSFFFTKKIFQSSFYKTKIINFYQTNLISKTSQIMRECLNTIKKINLI